MPRVSFKTLHVCADDREWTMTGDFEFDDEDDWEMFQLDVQMAFQMISGYPVPDVIRGDEYAAMNNLSIVAENILSGNTEI